MFHEMRLKNKALTPEETNKLLEECEYCVLGTVGADGWPYTVPLSYVMIDGKIYFHCFISGHKLENIQHEPRVCLNVATDTQPVWDNDYNTYYQSATVFGKARILEDGELKKKALISLVNKYLPEHIDKVEGIIESTKKATAVVEITVENATGKAKKRK